jgi:hypothetical protein
MSPHVFDIHIRTIANGSDNTPTVSWENRGSTSTTLPPAYLLWLQAMHQRYHCYTASDFYIPGTVNAMANDTSHLLHLTPVQLLTHFNTRYPQALPWRFVTPRPEMISSMTSALRRTRPDVGSFCQPPPATITPGVSGASSVGPPCWLIPGLPTSPNRSFSSKSSPTGTARAPLLPPWLADHTLEQALWAIGQTFSGLGSHNPSLDSHGHIDVCLRRQLTAYGKADNPPSRSSSCQLVRCCFMR